MVAQKAIRVNLSDLAAMGAEPEGYLLNIALPKKNFNIDKWLDGFSSGLKAAQQEFGWSLWGGDTVATTGPITISITAIGLVPKGKILTRSGAKVGDNIYVSGTLGDGAAGLRLLKDKHTLKDIGDVNNFAPLIERYHRPLPRLKLAIFLRDIATSAMDISDGLMADLAHICHNSNVGAVIEFKKLPVSPTFSNLLAIKKQYSILIWSGGDDYELLFTIADKDQDAIKELSRKLDIKLSKIGKITADHNIKLLDQTGSEIDISVGGFHHF